MLETGSDRKVLPGAKEHEENKLLTLLILGKESVFGTDTMFRASQAEGAGAVGSAR